MFEGFRVFSTVDGLELVSIGLVGTMSVVDGLMLFRTACFMTEVVIGLLLILLTVLKNTIVVDVANTRVRTLSRPTNNIRELRVLNLINLLIISLKFIFI